MEYKEYMRRIDEMNLKVYTGDLSITDLIMDLQSRGFNKLGFRFLFNVVVTKDKKTGKLLSVTEVVGMDPATQELIINSPFESKAGALIWKGGSYYLDR